MAQPQPTTTFREEPLCSVDAREAATGWLNAFLASGQDKQRAKLFRTMSLEFHREGLQLVATSGTALFRTWIRRTELPGPAAWPGNDEVPQRTVTVMDVEKFGLAFMKNLYQLTTKEDRVGERMTITIAPQDEGATLSLGTEFTTERVVIRTCGQRLDLPVMDGEYPNWRRMQLGIEARERVEGMIVAPALCGAVGKLAGVSALRFQFHGKEKQIQFEASDSPAGLALVKGLLMPMRRGLEDGVEPAGKSKAPKEPRSGKPEPHLKLT